MQAFEEFLQYKTRVPVRGAIMMNEAMDSVVLVKGWKKGANWSFPRGKINKDEDDLDCAIREVYEETGYDIKAAGLVPDAEDVHYIEMTMRDQQMRLYVFRNIPMDTHFEPRTRKEISKIQWYRLSDLPAFVKKKHPQNPNQDRVQAAQNANKFYMVAPFLKGLKQWVVKQKQKDAQRIASGTHFIPQPIIDDILTEEEPGTDNNISYFGGQSFINGRPQASMAGQSAAADRMADATAALKGLLKIQPPTQGLQTYDPNTSSVSRSTAAASTTGDALLAMLRGNPNPPGQLSVQSATMPQTPLDLTYSTAPTPRKPQHGHPRPPQFSALPPPPAFPFPAEPSPFPHNQINSQPFNNRPFNNQLFNHQTINARRPDLLTGVIAQQKALEDELQRRERSQQLLHPQPRPPPVQQAVFNGGTVHGPVMPQSLLQQTPASGASLPQITSNAQFPTVHGPILSSNAKQVPPKLTSHSLALLNAFKNRDDAARNAVASADLALQGFKQSASNLPPAATLAHGYDSLPVRTMPQMAPDTSARHVGAGGGKAPENEAHKSSLLDMFRQPAPLQPSQKAVLVATNGSSIAPTSSKADPSKESSPQNLLGLFEPKGSRSDRQAPNHAPKKGKGGTSALFDPKSMLARPSSSERGPQSGKSAGIPSEALPRLNGEHLPPGAITRIDSSIKGVDAQPKPFQPQILKRPDSSTASSANKSSIPFPANISTPTAQPQSTDRRPSQAPEHRQALLSLFGKSPASSSPMLSGPSNAGSNSERRDSLPSRGRVGSLASTTQTDLRSGSSTRRGSQAPMSPADKGFLLDFLNATVAKGAR
jgi:mRNA-decapping enzyme subunit 2